MPLPKSVFVHPHALVETDAIGEETRVWAFAHVMKGARIGERCNIGDHSFVESSVLIGNDVTIKNGVSIWEGVEIHNRVFIGPNVAFTNDLRPRSRVYHESPIPTLVGEGASVGANATVIAGAHLGKYSMVGAGAVVTKPVRDFELVAGNPAKHMGWISKTGDRMEFVDGKATSNGDSYALSNQKVEIILNSKS
jgi:UDP-2-acetamido-3-amino-2,3-dideoxy-glucuronate N-acetyltransferase